MARLAPVDRVQILRIYEWLRAENPHLPPSDTVIADSPMTITMQQNGMATITVEMYISVPKERAPHMEEIESGSE